MQDVYTTQLICSNDSMETQGERIKKLREMAGLTRGKLAKLADLAPSSISVFEQNKFRPKPDTVKRIADALGVPVQAILDLPPGTNHDNPQPYITRKLPMYGAIPCGSPREAWPIIDMVDVLAQDWGPDRFVLRAYGNSMAEEIRHGDLVVMEPVKNSGLDLADRQVAAVEFEGECTLKNLVVEWRGNLPFKVVLRPENAKYKTIEISHEKLDRLKVIAIAVSLCRRELKRR